MGAPRSKVMQKGRRALCVAAFVACATPGSPQPTETLTLNQARSVAAQAIRGGDFELARKLAMGLLQADPEDAYAYSVLTAAHTRLKNPDLARHAARLTYKYSDTPSASFNAARKAGELAYQQKRYNAAQLWLRRAAFHAPDEKHTKLLGRNYAQVRKANPLTLRFNFSVTPSDNVNNGSDAVSHIINGEPTGGSIGAGSRALSGIVGTADLSVKYRLRQTKKTRTVLNARIFTRRVALSSSARAAAPNVTNAELGSTYTDIGLSHSFGLKTPGAFATVSGNVGKTWAADSAQYTFARAGFAPSYKLTNRSRLNLNASIEQRWSTTDNRRDSTIARVSAKVHQKLKNGNKLSYGVNVQDVRSDATNASYLSSVVTFEYGFGKQIGPMTLSAGVSLGQTDYSTYGLPTPVAGGRQDTSLYGNVTMVFTDYDVAGFAPSLRVRAGGKTSNISRFETRELSVTLGIQSKF